MIATHVYCSAEDIAGVSNGTSLACSVIFLLLVHRRKVDIRKMPLLVPLVIITTIDWAMWSLLYSDPSIADLHCLLDSLGLPLGGHRTVPV
ncbi:hypothetical protein BDV41DRAFT_418778 [Aspergillus transmontanensis]|uniref:Uncharacterized protein n=1 Tax=Aspergillus transmontanensis TaxID=1034304 RepID=A0A5N6VMF2_9EURO|nr:hypothetical protein BDV41DRAFT_418778 [Aspergillus transmontanensis]